MHALSFFVFIVELLMSYQMLFEVAQVMIVYLEEVGGILFTSMRID